MGENSNFHQHTESFMRIQRIIALSFQMDQNANVYFCLCVCAASACLLFAQAVKKRGEARCDMLLCQKEIFRVLFDAKQCRYIKYIFKRFGGSDLCDH